MRIDRVKLFVAMSRLDLTQTELATKAKVCRPTVSAVYNGKSCSKETAEKLAKALEVEVKDLI